MRDSALIDYFRRRFPFESRFRVYAKRVVEDTRFLYRVFRPWRHLEERPPETLHIETTNVCNANCIFCAYQYQDRFREGKGVMSDKIFSRGLREYFEMGGRSVNFVPLVGDSLVDPKIIQRV